MSDTKDKKEAPVAEEKKKEEEEKPVDPDTVTLNDIEQALILVQRSVSSQETRFVARALRSLPKLRKRLNAAVLQAALERHFKNSVSTYREAIQQSLPSAKMNLDEDTSKASENATVEPVPEIELFIHMLVVIFLLDQNHNEKAMEMSTLLIAHVSETKRRSADQLAARAFFYYARAHELNGTYATIRGTLLAALRTATLRCDDIGQATLINLLLRNYLLDDLVGQADLLNLKTKFPENCPNNEEARHQYYLGRIKAVQLDYSSASRSLLQAIRKAPAGAVGFLQAAHKLSVIVQMLLGEIPERDQFRQPELRRALAPYFQLTRSVREGDLALFSKVVKENEAQFQSDKTYKLILRLRHNVIKTAVRLISLGYSRISLADVAAKLQLNSALDAEYIIAKSIRDGAIEATIDHDKGYMQSKDVLDVYSTNEPQDNFHQRIKFCLKIHNDSVLAMRFPPNAYRKYLETPEQRRERELQETEVAEEMEKDEEF